MDDLCEVIITAPDAEWLVEFTRHLVDERLAACGHTITPIRSIYRWSGALQDEPESRVALHTKRALIDRIVAAAAESHPADVPCVIATPLIGGNPAYLQWVRDETR